MLFISTPGDGKSFLLDADNSNVIRTYKSDPVHSIHAIVYNERSDIIITPQQKNCIFSFTPSMMQPTHKSFTTEIISALSLSPCGYFLVGGTADTGCLFVWCVATGELFRLIKSHIRDVKCIDFSSDGQLFASASSDSTVKIWKSCEALGMTSSIFLKPYQNISSHTLSVECCKFFRCSNYLATCSVDRTCRVFDSATGIQLFSHNTPHPLVTLAISPSDRGFVVGGADGSLASIELYPSQDNMQDIYNGNNTSKFWTPRVEYNDPFEGGHQRSIIGISYLPSELGRIIATSADGAILVWDIMDKFRLIRELTRIKKGILHVCPILFRSPASCMKGDRSVQLSKYPLDSMSNSYQLPIVTSLISQGLGQTTPITEGANIPHTYNKKKRKRMNEELANQHRLENETHRLRAAELAKKRSDLQELLLEFKKVTALEEKAKEKLSKLRRKSKK